MAHLLKFLSSRHARRPRCALPYFFFYQRAGKAAARCIPSSFGGMATVPRANFMWRQANPVRHSRANYPREESLQKVWTCAGAAHLSPEQKNGEDNFTLWCILLFVCLFFSLKIKLPMCVKRSVAVCSEAPQPVWLCCDALLWLRSALFVPSVISKKSTDLTPLHPRPPPAAAHPSL